VIAFLKATLKKVDEVVNLFIARPSWIMKVFRRLAELSGSDCLSTENLLCRSTREPEEMASR